MLNICFGDSECGTIKYALRGEKVICSYTSLEIGKIAPNDFDLSRKKYVDFSFNNCTEEERKDIWKDEADRFKQIISAANIGEDLKVWIATSPYSKCGYYHLIYNLQNVACKIYVVEMPENIGTNQDLYDRSWGEASPDEIIKCANLQRELSFEERAKIAQKWLMLTEENAELRLNDKGELIGVSIDFIDDEIMSNVPNGEFVFSKLLGLTLQNSIHILNVSFVAFRINKLVEKGRLMVVKYPEEDVHAWYQTILKRT